ncbi:MAG: hypothetical protein V5A55_09400 [Halovenus sp.]
MSGDGTFLQFETVKDPPGIEIVDKLEQLRYQLRTTSPVSPTPVPTDEFLFPVGKGVSVTTDAILLPNVVSVFVRDGAGNMVAEIDHLDDRSFDAGSYVLDFSTQIKTYLEVEGPLEVTTNAFQIRFEFPESTDVAIGFRSRHNRPAATVTTTPDPADVMAAISTFGSALKSTSPERSFPTLRGHPPEIELGSSLSIPDGLQRPDTGITIEVPATYEAIYPVAPLSYYLGAAVVPGDQPQIRTDAGFAYPFSYPHGFERDVERTLKQVFLLDCVTRTEGFYKVELRERNAVEESLDCDWASLYEQPLAERLEAYLDVPYEVLDPSVPEWRLTAHVEPVSDTVSQLPFVVDDLAAVRTASPTQQTGAVTTDPVPTTGGGSGFTRSVTRSSNTTGTRSAADAAEERTYVEFEPADSLEQAWIGDGIPIGASKLTAEAFRNRLDREVTAGNISITIVVNDSQMDEEGDLIDSIYGDREHLPFDVTVRRNLTVAQLRAQLREDCNFLHYIGHTEAGGFECVDGMLDAASLEETGVDAFLLNACTSYRQGLCLIEAGAIGGIVTLTDILNDGAIRIGETLANLLNAGFPLRAALTVARDESVLGGQYIVVGDGGMTVAQAASRAPNLLELERQGDRYAVTIQAYATDTAALGTMYVPHLENNEEYFLCSGSEGFQTTKEGLEHFLDLEDVPVRAGDGGIQWSSSLSVDELF